MSEFLSTLRHGRKLSGATKSLSVDELEGIVVALRNIIETRKQKEAEKQAANQEKRETLEKIKAELNEYNLTLEDLMGGEGVISRRAGQKRPKKYEIVDEDGNLQQWTGIGKMPVIFKNALQEGKSLDDFKIAK